MCAVRCCPKVESVSNFIMESHPIPASWNTSKIPAAECDPVLLQLMDLYTKKDALNMVAKLDQIAVESGSRNSRQEALGTLDCISIIFSFFASIMGAGVTTSDNELSLQQSCAFVMDPVDVADVELQRQLVEKSLWVLVRLCRREMAKSTASIANIELIENYPQSFELINNVASKLVCYSQIAYPVTYLFMILASDSAERQYKLILAGAPVLVVSIINQNITDDLVIEMSCRALRNLAAGEADLVAKMVEDKVCESLVRVLHTQLGTVPEKIGTADGNTISLNPENILVELDNTSGIENETLTSAVHTNIVGSQSVVDESHDQQFVTVDKIVNESVCEAALWAIVNLACDENVSTIFGTIGGVEALVEVAQKCKNSSTVSLAAVSALRNISSVGTLNYTLLAKTEVCQVLLDIFKEHSTDLDVVETSLWTITNLACDSILSNRLGSLHAAEIIVDIYFSIVPNHPPEGRPAGPISEAILWTIVNLAAAGTENEDRLGAAGAVELVGLIMNIYIHREGMVELAFNSLIHLIYHSELNKSRVGGSGSVRTELVDTGKNIFMTVCKAMIDYKDNENIIENVFRFFLLSLNGSSSDVNKLLLLSDNLNLFSLISEVLSINAIQTEVIRLGCGLLLVLKYEDNDYREKLRIAGQLDYKGKASPKGTFEEIAVAWGFEDKRVPGAGIGPQISSLEMSM